VSQSFTKRCRKNDEHLLEDLAKSGYKPDMKYKSLTILYFWLLTENRIQKSGDLNYYYYYFSVTFLAIENLQNQFILKFSISISLLEEQP
jgi:hypothetical protein